MIPIDLGGKNVLITGAGGGIAQGIARCYAAAGAALLLTDINTDAMQPLKEELQGQGAQVETARLDVTDEAAVRTLIDDRVQRMGSLDVLCNGAGIFVAKPYMETTAEEFTRILAINLVGMHNCCQAALVHMRKQKSGCIVNIASASTRQGSPIVAHYSASKFGVQSLTQSIALDVAALGIRANAICPGYVYSQMTPPLFEKIAELNNISYEEALKLGEQSIPMGRFQTAEDIGNMAVFLSSSLAQNITAQTINVDGGMRMN